MSGSSGGDRVEPAQRCAPGNAQSSLSPLPRPENGRAAPAHAGAIGVAQGLAGKLLRLAAPPRAAPCRAPSLPPRRRRRWCRHPGRARRARAGVGAHDALAAEEGVDELRAVVAAAGEQHVFGTVAEQALERLVELGATRLALASPPPSSSSDSAATSSPARPVRRNSSWRSAANSVVCGRIRSASAAAISSPASPSSAAACRPGSTTRGNVRIVGEDLRDHRDVLDAAAEMS